MGAILAQYQEKQGRYQVVRYDSRPLTDPETRYSQIEVESLAVKFAIEKNYIYLYGLPHFEVITDHKPLLTIYNKYVQDLSPRIRNHKFQTQGYNFTLKYEKGINNPSDYLSRHPGEQKGAENTEIDLEVLIQTALPDAVTVEEVREHTKNDRTLQLLKKSIERDI